MELSLCMPGAGLSCLACCPPIRPAGYEHLADAGIWRRILAENRAAFLADGPPRKAITGFSCPGLGWLDDRGRLAGCLLHPAGNQGRDLRGPTGFQEKCARESCPEARAFACLARGEQAALIALCTGLDTFHYSAVSANPVRRLLAFGPEAARLAVSAGARSRAELAGWPWLYGADPTHGWLLGKMGRRAGPGILRLAGLADRLASAAQGLTKALSPPPPLEQGSLLGELCDEWEARFWRSVTGRRRATMAQLAAWRPRARG